MENQKRNIVWRILNYLEAACNVVNGISSLSKNKACQIKTTDQDFNTVRKSSVWGIATKIVYIPKT